MTPGVRLEEARFTSLVSRSGDMDVSQGGGGSASGVVPGIGMVAGTPKANVYAGMHVGWAPPRVTSPISPKGQAVTQLQPESSINYELGTRLTYKRLLHFEGTAYLIDFNNQVITSSGDLSSGNGTTELVNGGATRHYGVEGAASFGLGEALRIRPTAIDFTVRYTLARAYFDGGPWNGNYLPYAPAALLSAFVDVDHRSGLGGELAWTYVGDQFTDAQNTLVEDATGRTGKIPAYNTVDASLRYRMPKPRITWKLAAKDALDQTFIYARRPDGIRVGGFRENSLRRCVGTGTPGHLRSPLSERWEPSPKRWVRPAIGISQRAPTRRAQQLGDLGDLLRLDVDLRASGQCVLGSYLRVFDDHRTASDAAPAAAFSGVRRGGAVVLRRLGPPRRDARRDREWPWTRRRWRT